jgi:hypothetical protein
MDPWSQQSEPDSAEGFLPVPNAVEIFWPVRFKSGRNFISCFILHKDSSSECGYGFGDWLDAYLLE